MYSPRHTKNNRIHSPVVTPYRFPERVMDYDALSIIQRLQRFGYLAYFVGGCVRDVLLDQTPKDFDIVTSAHPREIRKIFRNAHLIGRRFKLAHLHFSKGKVLEVATFRQPPSSDSVEDGVIVEDNEFGTPATDAYRRDFTINALFYDPLSGEIIDYVNGLQDIKDRKIRSIGEPTIRFREDPVRMLRAIKFAARLNLTFDTLVFDAMEAERDSIVMAARPRLQQELIRYLQGGAAKQSFELLIKHRLLQLLSPEISAWFSGSKIRIDSFLSLLESHDLHTASMWKNSSKEELILSVMIWPWINGLIMGDETQEFTDPIPKRQKKLKLLILRMLAPSATRLGMSIKTLHGLARIMTTLLLHRLESRQPKDLQNTNRRQALKGSNILESLLLLKARHHSGLEPELDWTMLNPILEEIHVQNHASQKIDKKSQRVLMPSKPVIKPTERRRRKSRK
jgi:poly(A) polymerase